MNADERYRELVNQVRQIWHDQTISEERRTEILTNLRNSIDALLKTQAILQKDK